MVAIDLNSGLSIVGRKTFVLNQGSVMKKCSVIAIAVLILSSSSFGALANSFGFDSNVLVPQSGMVSISVDYDFTEYSMFGGRVNIVYDSDAIEFVKFNSGLLPPDVEIVSTAGVLTEPGLIAEFGLLATNFFNAANSQGRVGTFYFNILGEANAGATPCGKVLCIVEDPLNPFVTALGTVATDDILAASITEASIAPVPLPASFWFLLSGMAFFARRRV